MNRRDFLSLTARLAAGALASGSVVSAALAAGPAYGTWRFDPTKEYGNSVYVSEFSGPVLDDASGVLYDDMVRCVPPECRDKVRVFARPSRAPLERGGAVAWRYTP